MRTTRYYRMKTSILGLTVAFVLLFGGKASWALDISSLLQTFQTLSTSEQDAIISQILGTDTTTSTEETTTTDTTDNSSGLPHGSDTIDYVREFSPGSQVNLARSGEFGFIGKVFTQPVEEPDFWQRVQLVFLEGLLQALNNVYGLGLTSTSSVTIAGQ